MKLLVLSDGSMSQVDDDVYEWARAFKWHPLRRNGGDKIYVKRSFKGPDKRQRGALLHREILKAPQGVPVDHRDNDGLNNQRSNLRFASSVTNKQNGPARRDNLSTGFKGVSNTRGRFQARIKVNKVAVELGCYATPVEAAQAYNKAALLYFGEFAWLNQIPQKGGVVPCGK